RRLAYMGLRTARRAARDPRPSAGGTRARGRQAAGARRRTPLRRRAGRLVPSRRAWSPESDPPREPRAPGAARAGAPLRDRGAARRHRAFLQGGPPSARRGLADLLALGLALPGAGHAD